MLSRKRINPVPGIILGILLISGNPSYAQKQGGPTVEDMLAKIRQDLNLTEEQVTRIKSIVEEEAQKMTSLMERMSTQGAGAHESVRTEMEKIRQEMEDQLIKCLDEEQMAKWKKQKESAWDEKRDPQGAGQPSGGRWNMERGRKGW